MKDSILVVTDSITKTNAGFSEISKNCADNLVFSFWVSVILLIIISLFKYFIAKECEKKDFGNFILEFPIDVCQVVIAIIATGIMKEPSLNVGVILLLTTFLISAICCIFRRYAIKYSYRENCKWIFLLLGSADVMLALVWTTIIYIKYFKL